MQKESSDICGQQRPRSACASAQSDQGLHYPLTESFDILQNITIASQGTDDFANVQDVNSHILRMFESIFS